MHVQKNIEYFWYAQQIEDMYADVLKARKSQDDFDDDEEEMKFETDNEEE